MDKKTFLSELEQALSVLREDELRDILDEYAQHIDMKVERGLSEEEAISDFGSFSELTAEILEAYHVRQDYGKVYEDRNGGKGAGGSSDADAAEKKPWTRLQKGVKKSCQTLEGGCQRMGKGFLSWCRMLWQWLAAACIWCGHILMKPVEWLRRLARTKNTQAMSPGEDAEERDALGEEREMRGQNPFTRSSRCSEKEKKGAWKQMINGFKGMCRKFWNGIAVLWNWTLKAAIWGIRLLWNSCVILFALTVGLFGVCCLFLLGVAAVLLAEGYPLLGVTIGGTGITVSIFAVVFFSLTLLIRKRKPEVRNMEITVKEDETEEEVLPNA